MYGQKITTSGTGSKVTSIAHVSLQEKSTTVIPTRSSSHHEKQSDGSHTTLPKPATNKDDTPQTCDEVSTPDPCLEAINESSVVDNVIHTDADDLVSLATISVLENIWIRRRSIGSRQIYDSIVTLFGKRLLQERLAKSSAKAKELQLQSTSRR
ncbi:hypothetical protein F2Q70_00022927 [Brassica cretica]|uniref:Uncharacterized protein n=1 Tax=Brassica cretica TaxID=69181 RepID=A0A8S9GHJ7_BRACR|nr:hypothetical protein F2Q70_00022927 [Brassica cretica]